MLKTEQGLTPECLAGQDGRSLCPSLLSLRVQRGEALLWRVWPVVLHEPREPVLGEVAVGNGEMATRNPHASQACCEVSFSGTSGDYCARRQSSFILPSKISLSAPALSSLPLLCFTVPKAASHALVPFRLTPKAAAHGDGLGREGWVWDGQPWVAGRWGAGAAA